MRTNTDSDVWARLAAPVPDDTILWRQDGLPVSRDGRFYARFVAYIEANTVRDRLGAVVPGEWELSLEMLPFLCPKCGGPVWDNRSTKRNPRAPDYKRRDRACDGVIWPARPTPLPAEAIPF